MWCNKVIVISLFSVNEVHIPSYEETGIFFGQELIMWPAGQICMVKSGILSVLHCSMAVKGILIKLDFKLL